MLSVEFGKDSCEFGNRERGVLRGYAMSQKRRDERDAVLGNDETAAGEVRLGAEGGYEEVQSPWRNAEAEAFVSAGGVGESDQFLNDDVVDPDGRGFFHAGAENVGAERRDEGRKHRFHAVRTAGTDDFRLYFVARVSDFHYRGKAVFLGFGQEESPHVFERVLRGDDEVELRKRECRTRHGNGLFFHAFQKRALGFGVHAVDFVDKHDFRENRSFPYGKLFRGEVERFASHDVLRKAVRGSLDAGMRKSEKPREGFGDGRLPYSGEILDKHVPAHEKGDFEELRDFGFSEDERKERFLKFLELLERI